MGDKSMRPERAIQHCERLPSSGTTDSTGLASVTITGPDPSGYSLKMSYGGQTATQQITGCGTYEFGWECYQVLGCTAMPANNASVTFTGGGNDATPLTISSDSNGYACFLYYESYTLTAITGAGFKNYPAFGGPVTGSGCMQIQMASKDGYICCGCAMPICQTLSCSDSVVGGCTLTYGGIPAGWDGAGDWSSSWNGKVSYSYQGKCGCPACSVDIIYVFACSGATFTMGVSVQCSQGLTTDCPCTAGGVACPGIDSSTPPPGSLCGGPVMTLSSLSCDPIDVEFTGTSGCPCANCFQLGVNWDCGCGDGSPANGQDGDGISSIWGDAIDTPVTITVTDSC